MSQRCIGIFSSIHFVLKAEKLLKKSGFEVETMPVPRKISADCGIAITFLADDIHQVKDLLQQKKCHLEGIYTESSDGTYRMVD